MFVVTRQSEPLSHSRMKFLDWWIYDLTAFHSFWRKLVQNKKNVFIDPTPWGALRKAYGIHLFSSLETLIPLAKDFHTHHVGTKENEKQSSLQTIDAVFKIFSHLGLKKIEQLKRFSRTELQRRFGPSWAEFFEGILNPNSLWCWQPYRSPEILFSSYEFEDFCIDSSLLLKEVDRCLQKLSLEHPLFVIQSMKLSFILSQENEMLKSNENQILFSFTYEPLLQKDIPWILKLAEEKLSHLCFDYPIWKFYLELYPASAKREYQLSLFKNAADTIAWSEVCRKLKDQNFHAFQPAATPSYLPEKSWRMAPAENAYVLQNHALLRPLIQEEPQSILEPEGSLKFTERLTWIDEKGETHQRNYFIARATRAWIWVFKNEKDEWFKQGIIE